MTQIRIPKFRTHSARGLFCADFPVAGSRPKRVYFGADESAARDRYNAAIASWIATGQRTAPSTNPAASAQPTSPMFVGFDRIAAIYARKCRRLHRMPRRFKNADHILVTLRLACRVWKHLDARSIDAIAIEKLQRAMVDAKWSIRTIRKRLPHVRNALFDGAKGKLIAAGIVQEFSLSEKLRTSSPGVIGPVERLPADLASVEVTKHHCTPTVAALIDVLLMTGARPGEIFAMRAIDLDRSGPVWKYSPTAHKSAFRGKSRTILIGPKAQEVLLPFITGRIDLPIFSPARSEQERRQAIAEQRKTPLNEGNRAGTNRRDDPKKTPGDRWTAQAFGHAINAAQVKASKESTGDFIRWTAYQIRHLALTKFRAAGSLDDAATLAGHSSAMLTDAVYARRDQTSASALIQRIG